MFVLCLIVWLVVSVCRLFMVICCMDCVRCRLVRLLLLGS